MGNVNVTFILMKWLKILFMSLLCQSMTPNGKFKHVLNVVSVVAWILFKDMFRYFI